ncbi:hypothetical protein L3Q82_006572 [Scortum barcoo]|uniref:Uncharacterized protein n=1 Tax=Scortum barcoo TaxID=214431 RepID=A0ACB8X0I5_9TELE|nr:hypothetical protein L3Q82_006572 [Scortum barcoo]
MAVTGQAGRGEFRHAGWDARKTPITTAAVMPGLDQGNFPDLSRIPPCYHDLREMFNKAKATSLPPHRPWDCAIDLLPGAPIPKVRLYSISGPERKAMDKYIEASLRSGIICPSSSPAGASFFLSSLRGQ